MKNLNAYRFSGGLWRSLAVVVAAAGLWLGTAEQAHAADGDWETLEDCSHIPNWGNDGDSFHMRCPALKHETEKRRVFRLYYVDTPESDESIPERVEVQREYWDLPDAKTVVKMGKAAGEFTDKWLKGKKVRVHTQWEDAQGRTELGRNYAMIEIDEGDLGYALVLNGLARVYGRGPELDGLGGPYKKMSANAWWAHLRKAEAEAKHARRGCWAYSGSKGAKRAAAEEAGGADGTAPSVPPPSVPARRGTVGPHRAAPLGAVPPPAAPATVYPVEITTTRAIFIYSLKDPVAGPLMGQLRAGMALTALEEVSPERVRVRFRLSSGEVYEGTARKADLGLR